MPRRSTSPRPHRQGFETKSDHPEGGGTDLSQLPNPPTALEKLELAHKALVMRRDGLGYEDIAREMNLKDARAAEVMVRRLLKKGIRESFDELKTLDLMRLDRYQAVLSDIIEGSPRNAIRAIEVAMQVMKRRADLVGLDAAAKMEVEAKKTTVVEYYRDDRQDEHKQQVEQIIEAEYSDLDQLEERFSKEEQRKLPEHADQAPGSPDQGSGE